MLNYFIFLLYFVFELKILYDYYFCFIFQNPLLSRDFWYCKIRDSRFSICCNIITSNTSNNLLSMLFILFPNKKYFHTPQKNQNITLIMQRYKKNRYQHLILLNIFRNLILSFTHSNLHPTFKQENGHFHTSHLQSLQSVYFSYRKIYHKKPTLQLQSCKVQINLWLLNKKSF